MQDNQTNDDETEFQKLAKVLGDEPRIAILRELATVGDQYHSVVKLIYHQITYWEVLESEKLPYLRVVIENYSDLINENFQNLEVLTHIFSGASLLLYALYKSRGDNLEDLISVEPLDVKHLVGETGQFVPTDGAKLQLSPLNSASDFFAQLKTIVGECFGLLLAFVAGKITPLLEKALLVEVKTRKDLPSLRPVISFLQQTLSVFQANLVYLSLSQLFFSEVFARINKILMNGVLLRQRNCTETFGAYLKSEIEFIRAKMGQAWIGDVTESFQGIQQVASVLVLSDKFLLVEDTVRQASCPSLNTPQIRQLLSMFTPGQFGKRVPISVINAIGAGKPRSSSDRILIDVNVVRLFPVKVLHYFDAEDMLCATTTPLVRSLVENISYEIRKAMLD